MILCVLILVSGCTQQKSPWNLVLQHDNQGDVQQGSEEALIASIRMGCQIRVAWGARRRSDPSRTIEHVATPIWVSVRNGETVEVQLDEFMINLDVLGHPPAEFPQLEPYGGTERPVMWRATLKTDGTFDAVWFDASNGDYITRVPQRHPMKWYVDCIPQETGVLYPENE